MLSTFLPKGEDPNPHATKVMHKLFPIQIGFKPQETMKRHSQAALTKAVFEYVKSK